MSVLDRHISTLSYETRSTRVRAGKLPSLIAYAAALSCGRPSVPADADFPPLFWRTLGSFTSGAAFGDALLGLANDALLAGDDEASSGISLALADGLVVGMAYLPTVAGQTALLSAAHALRSMLVARVSVARLDEALRAAENFLDVGLAIGGVGLCGTVALLSAATTDSSETRRVPRHDLDPLCNTRVYLEANQVGQQGGNGGARGVWDISGSARISAWLLADVDAYLAIPVCEFLLCGFDKFRFEHSADAVRRFIDRFNAVSLWTRAEALASSTPSGRSHALSNLIGLGSALLGAGDYAGATAVAMGLRLDDVKRLTASWALVDPKSLEAWRVLSDVTEDRGQYRNYKAALKKAMAEINLSKASNSTQGAVENSRPCVIVPHIGAHTSELSATEMNLPETLAHQNGGPKDLISILRPRTLWGLTAPLVSLQERAYKWASQLKDDPERDDASRVLHAALLPFYFVSQPERDEVSLLLERRSQTIE